MKIQTAENIDLSQSERYILTIRIHPEQFSFSIYNPMNNASYFYHSIERNKQSSAFHAFKDAYYDNEFFSLPYKKIYIINHTPVFTYIPSIIFENKDKDVYLNFLFMGKAGKSLFHNLQIQGITIVHVMSDEVYEFIQRSFIDVRIIHHTAPLITYLQAKKQIINQKKMLVNLQNTEIDILCFSHETFLLGNHFDCSSFMDAMYYILFIWKQLNFDQLNDFIYVAGDTQLKKVLIEKLNTYLQYIIPVGITPEAHLECINAQIIPFEMACLSLDENCKRKI
jgi:hypothetical protein